MQDRISRAVSDSIVGVMSGDAAKMRVGFKVLMATAVNPLASRASRARAANVLKTRLGMTTAETNIADQKPTTECAVIPFTKRYLSTITRAGCVARCASMLVILLAGIMFADVADPPNNAGYALDAIISLFE